jgi:tripartite-type tricarboxylate transporter receptor subunit TctC
MKTILHRWVAVVAVALFASTASMAQPYPTKPVKVIVGFVAGGAPDFVARALTTKLSESLGQSFIVDNKPGAGGSLSTSFVAKSAPDGYTLLLADTATLMLAPHLFKGTPSDTIKEFTPVGLVTTEPLLIVSNGKTSIKTLKDLIAQAKAAPGKISYGSSGIGSIHHVCMEVFKTGTGLDLVHVPYKGSGQSILAVLSGDVPITITSFAAAEPHIRSGAINLLAVTAGQRLPAYPDVPSLAEYVKNYDYGASFGILAPLGTPQDAVTKLSDAIKQATESKDFIDRFKGQATVIQWTSPSDYLKYLRENQTKFDRAAKLVNLQSN